MARLANRSCAAGVLAAALGVVGAARADEDATRGCALKPIQDVAAAQSRVRTWADATRLPPFDEDRSELSIDRSRARLTLRFRSGELTVAWVLDDDCTLDTIEIEASKGYAGPRPDEEDVRRLAAELEAVGGTLRVAEPYVPGRSTPDGVRIPLRIWRGIAAAALVLALLWVARSWRGVATRAWRSSSVEAARAVSAVGAGARAVGVRSATWAQAGSSRMGALVARAFAASASSWLRASGLVGVVVLLPYQSTPAESGAAAWLAANAVVFVGVLPLVAFLWLVVSGFFGWGSLSRADWPAVVVFLLALGIREGIARHAIGDNELYFHLGVSYHRHSVVHPLLQMFLQRLARDPYAWMLHVNGALGALAVLPLFLFVRQRTGSVRTAGLVATFVAVHPVIVQMAPTDLPYSLLLCTWFAGLALLSAEVVGPRQLVAGAALLGIAATCRAEGSLYLLASLLLLDVRALVAAARAHPRAAFLGTGALLGLLAVHVVLCFSQHVESGETLPRMEAVGLGNALRAGLFSYDYNHPTVIALVMVGALAGLLDGRSRLGLAACMGAVVVIWPFAAETDPIRFLGMPYLATDVTRFLWIHRLVPACALQAMAAGVGASWLVSTLSRDTRGSWPAVLPALGVALLVFFDGLSAIRAPNALTDEFWMLRRRLAPGGEVEPGCALLSVGRRRDTDIQELGQIVPGMRSVHCEHDDCIRIASEGGCFYYVRSVNCFFFESGTPLACRLYGETSTGSVAECLDARCARIERELVLAPLEERTVDVDAAFPDPQMPQTATIGVYRVLGVRR